MRAGGLVARRGRAHRGPLVVLGVLVATVAATSAVTVGHTGASAAATVHAAFATAPPDETGLRVQTRLATDPDGQHAAVGAALAALMPSVPLDVQRSLTSEPVALVAGGREARVTLTTGEDAVGRGDLDPPGPGEALVPEAVAAELGVGSGDTVEVEGVPLTVAGTWQPGADARDGEDTTLGAVLVDAATLAETTDAPFVRWTLRPVAAGLDADDLPVLADGADRLEGVLDRDDAVAVRGLTVSGGLAATATEVARAGAAAGVVGRVPLVLLAVIALVALVQVVRLLGQGRAQEVEILVARGAEPRTLTRWAGLEALVVAAGGAAVGTAVAAAVVTRLDGGAAQLGAVLLTGVVVALGAFTVAVVVAGAQVRAAARRMVTDRSGRLREAAAAGSVLLAGVAALLAAWQLRRFGTPLVVGADGQTRTDVLAVASLAAVLTALAMVALALLGPLTRSGERLAARARRLAVPLAGRQVSRRLRAYAVPVVLLSLAAGAVTSAGAFAGTTATQREQAAGLATGSDVRVHLPPRPTARLGFPVADSAVPYARIEGVAAAASVLRQDATLGQAPVTLTALPTHRVADVVRAPAGLGLAAAVERLVPAPRDDDAGDVTPPGVGLALPAGTAALELEVRVRADVPADVLARRAEDAEAYAEILRTEGATEEEVRIEVERRDRVLFADSRFSLATAVWVADSDGALSLLGAGSLVVDLDDPGAGDVGPQPAVHALAVDLPGDDEYRVVAVEVTGNAAGTEAALDYEVSAVRAADVDGGGPDLGPGWALAEDVATGLVEPGPLGTIGLTTRLGGEGAPGRFLARLVPGGADGPVPALLTTALAEHASLAVGDEVPIALAGPEVDLEVVGLIDAVPGGLEEHAVLVDQGVLGASLLRGRPNLPLPTQVWLAVDEPATDADVAAAALAAVGRDGEVEVARAAGVDATGSVREAFWLAAAGSAVLALTGAAAVALALTRERRGEVVVLRALGQTPAGQARTRSGELLGVGALGVVLGTGAGWLASWLLVPTLARAAATVTSPLALAVGLDVVPTALLLGAVLAGLLAVGGVVAARVRAQARDAEYREEIR
ncbi:FtsX-like permease family protein [Georgenia faecalis]|uniref:FtsX-like permease family protein n=1 Tax=Georgenia faecalis TaxID=2483799 RepID=A0ABV9D5U0_9MICO|nr:FtsX-like permease family protein [Georgenia faecalis]